MSQPPASPTPRVHVLTAEKIGETVAVRPGDELVVKLPIQSSFRWGLLGDATNLTEIKVPLQLVPAKEAASPTQVSGGPTLQESRYRVGALPKDQSVQWVYCFLGKTSQNGVPVKAVEPLADGKPPKKPGTSFSVKLVPAKATPAPADPAAK